MPVDYAINYESTIQEGDVVCLSAWYSVIGKACGTVAQVYDPNHRGMVRVRDFDACGGDSGGWYVDLLHVGNVMTRYCHMNAPPEVKVGDKVIAGQPIGIVGSTGHSSGPHVHFEVYIDADQDGGQVPVDPDTFMRDNAAPLGQ